MKIMKSVNSFRSCVPPLLLTAAMCFGSSACANDTLAKDSLTSDEEAVLNHYDAMAITRGVQSAVNKNMLSSDLAQNQAMLSAIKNLQASSEELNDSLKQLIARLDNESINSVASLSDSGDVNDSQATLSKLRETAIHQIYDPAQQAVEVANKEVTYSPNFKQSEISENVKEGPKNIEP